MKPTILDGREVSTSLRSSLREECMELVEKGHQPGLAVVLVGNNQASRTYVNMKKKAAEALGFHFELIELPEDTSEVELLTIVEEYNHLQHIDGILVQLPLPKHIHEQRVIEAISPDKDVDGFHPVNVGRLSIGLPGLKSCTPYGIMKMLEYYGVELEGKNAVVVGRSNIVGKPMAQLLLQENATVTIAHSRTQNLSAVTKEADILISAVGVKGLITKNHVKPGAVVVDVGMNRDEEGKLCGDVEYNELLPLVSAITPVPGGVGPMTITMLLNNTIEAARHRLLTSSYSYTSR